MRTIKNIVIHCSATPPEMDVDAATVRGWHMNERKWSDIGYHYFIKRDGTIEKGRSLSRSGAHVKGWNKTSIGICYAGGVDANGRPEDNRTAEQTRSLMMLARTLEKRFQGSQVLGHRDFEGVSKACPSFDVKSWYYGR